MKCISSLLGKTSLLQIMASHTVVLSSTFRIKNALRYKCHSAATNMLYGTDPVIIKHIGGSCKGKNEWDKVAQVVMEQGVYAKFFLKYRSCS